jgi:hypothetical protein
MNREARAELNGDHAPFCKCSCKCPQWECVRFVRGSGEEDDPLGPFTTEKFVRISTKGLLNRL